MQADVTICGKEKHQQCAWSKGTAFQMKQSLPAPPTGRRKLSNYSQLATIQKEIQNIYKTISGARNETASRVC